jgi:hypothetical protein
MAMLMPETCNTHPRACSIPAAANASPSSPQPALLTEGFNNHD